MSERKMRSIRIEHDGIASFHGEGVEGNAYTLCGTEVCGDDAIGLSVGNPSTRRINCPQCVRLILHCKNQIRINDVDKAAP